MAPEPRCGGHRRRDGRPGRGDAAARVGALCQPGGRGRAETGAGSGQRRLSPGAVLLPSHPAHGTRRLQNGGHQRYVAARRDVRGEENRGTELFRWYSHSSAVFHPLTLFPLVAVFLVLFFTSRYDDCSAGPVNHSRIKWRSET